MVGVDEVSERVCVFADVDDQSQQDSLYDSSPSTLLEIGMFSPCSYPLQSCFNYLKNAQKVN